MRSRFVSVVLLAALLVLNSAWAVPRTVLLEGFTQWNCGPCAAWNPTERLVTEQLGLDTVAVIKYHVWWPSPNNDPMYLWNTTEASARTNYYSVTGVPDGYLDGRTRVTRTETWLRNNIRARAAVPAPCTIELTACASSPTVVDISGVITATDSALSNVQLFVALVTNLYAASGAGNGETEFPYVFRDMWPNTSGQTISIPLGGTYTIAGTLNKDASWNATSLSVVVFIQNYSTKWVHQAGVFPVYPLWGMATTTEDPPQIAMTPLDEATYFLLLENVSCNNDIYTVQLTGSLADGWSRSVEATGLPGSTDSIVVPLSSGGSTWLTLHVSPNGHPGMALTDLTVISNGNRSVTKSHRFRALADVDVLIVDDDGGAAYGNVESFYLNSLAAPLAGRAVGVWDVAVSDLVEEATATPSLVIWFAGANTPGNSVSLTEQAWLASVLDRGGSLLLTGQNMPYDFRSSPFLTNYLHSRFSFVYLQASTVVGLPEDPISDGLEFTIHGGDGADNQTRPSGISPNDAAATIFFEFAGSQYHAGVRVEGPNYRAVMTGFGYESIDNQADRDTVMARTVRWLLGLQAADPAPVERPREFSLGAAYPNPFNPVTTIPYALPERAEVTLRVFDLLGREVAVLVSGVQDAGEYRVNWRADEPASGVYLCRLDAVAGGRAVHATQKLMLLK